MAGRGNESYACVALNQGGHILGIMELRSPRRNAFSVDDLHDLECAAAIVAAVISAASRIAPSDNAGPPFRSGTTPAETRITSQRLPENRLVQAAKLMSVGEMAAGIAHELNNPLTTVAGFAELLLDEIAPDAPFRADVEMVMHEAQRARGVVRRLLDFARQGEGARSRADIGEILEDVVALTTHFIHTSGVKLDVVLTKDMPWVLVDNNQMKQVFLNLIHNALQAMPAGGVLQVRTEVSRSDERQWVVVRIVDNGLGIRPADMARIFEPFFTTRAQHGGTGLGLSVSYGIVADHGGKIEVESQPGVGSTFSVWLPA
jgi:two-component system NtrC family sensor kinase